MDTSSAIRYDISKLKLLEAKALEKMSKGQDCLDVNLTILRFYHFHKELMNVDVIGRILGKALTVLPDTDFKLYLHLLPESAQRVEPIASLILLANHLESGRFQQFWLAVEAVKDSAYSISDFYSNVRRYILLTVSLTFQKISESLLASYLYLPRADFEALIKEKCEKEGWSKVPTPKGSVICLPKKEKGHQTSGFVSTGKVDFNEIVSLAHALDDN
eukprot:g4979.t1